MLLQGETREAINCDLLIRAFGFTKGKFDDFCFSAEGTLTSASAASHGGVNLELEEAEEERGQ